MNMNTNNIYEKSGLVNRVKESGSIFLFIFIALIASLVIMNLLIFPIALFSINHNILFTAIVKVLFIIFITGSIGYLLIKRIIFYKNEPPNFNNNKEYNFQAFILYIIFLFFLRDFFIIILLISSILQKNYYLLYKTTNF